MKFAICNEIFGKWKLPEAFAFAAQAGYEGVEIAPFTIARYVTDVSVSERQAIRELAQREQIAISGIHWVLAQTEGLHLTDRHKGVRVRTAQYLSDLVDFCADLGGRFMIVGSPKQRSLGEGISREEGWAWATESFKPAVSRAAERGVTICLEPLAPAETNFINTAAEAIAFVQQWGSQYFKIILDVKAMSSEAKPVERIIRESSPHFAYFHANDKNLKGPGFGEIQFQPILAALQEIRYAGWVSVEVFNFDEGPELIATKSLACLREARAAAQAARQEHGGQKPVESRANASKFRTI